MTRPGVQGCSSRVGLGNADLGRTSNGGMAPLGVFCNGGMAARQMGRTELYVRSHVTEFIVQFSRTLIVTLWDEDNWKQSF